jgi:hypothetical protein
MRKTSLFKHVEASKEGMLAQLHSRQLAKSPAMPHNHTSTCQSIEFGMQNLGETYFESRRAQ